MKFSDETKKSSYPANTHMEIISKVEEILSQPKVSHGSYILTLNVRDFRVDRWTEEWIVSHKVY